MKKNIFVLATLFILSACNGLGSGKGSATSSVASGGGGGGGGGGTSASSAPTGAVANFYDLNVFIASKSPAYSYSLNSADPSGHSASNNINNYDGSGNVTTNRWSPTGANFYNSSENLQSYISETFNSGNGSNLLSHIGAPLLILCAVQALNPGDNSFFTATSGSVVRTVSINPSVSGMADCVGGAGNLASALAGFDLSLTFQVALTSNTTNYDFKITFTSQTSGGSTDPLNIVMYFRNSTTHLNILMIADYRKGTTTLDSEITSISYIKSTQVTVLEHLTKYINDTNSSDGFGDTDFGRMIINPGVDDIRIVTHKKYEAGGRASLSFATSATNLDYLSLSASWANLAGDYSADVTNAGACIEVSSNYFLKEDGTSTCSGKTALPASDMNAVTASLYSIAPSAINSAMAGSYYESKLPSFTAATILSAAHGL